MRRAFYHGPDGAVGAAAHSSLTVRDVIAWAVFCVGAVHSGKLPLWEAYVHGAYLTLLDGLGLGLGLPEAVSLQLRAACETFLRSQLPLAAHGVLLSAAFATVPPELGSSDGADDAAASVFGAGPFHVSKVRSRAVSSVPLRASVGQRLLPRTRYDDEMNELQLISWRCHKWHRQFM